MPTLPDGTFTYLKRRRNGPKKVASSSSEATVLEVIDSDEEGQRSGETKALGSRSEAQGPVDAPEASVRPSALAGKAGKASAPNLLEMLNASRSRMVASPSATGCYDSCVVKDKGALVRLGDAADGLRDVPAAATPRSATRPKKPLRLSAGPSGPSMALVIKKRWCDEIFDGSKVWEIRGTPVAKRGRVAIAQSKSKQLVGEATVVACLKVGRRVKGRLVAWSKEEKDEKNFIGKKENLQYHRVEDLSWVKYKKVYAWVLQNRKRYTTPLPYKHTQGCVTWVKLDAETSRRAHYALPRAFKAPLSLRPCVIDVL